ncbi:MAG: GAF domain-containing protein [Candidatus Binatia bacterium]
MEWQRVKGLVSLRRGGIRRRFLFIGLLFLALALLVNTVAGFLYTRGQIKHAAARLQSEIASRVAHEIETFIERKLERLQDLSASLGIYEPGSEQQRLLSLLLLKNDNAFSEIKVLNREGLEVLKISERRVYLPTDLSDQSKSERFKKVISGHTEISPVYTSDTAEPYVTLGVPIRVGPKQIIGTVYAELNLKFLWQIIGDVEFGKAGYAYLVDSEGNLIAHRDPSLVLKRTNLKHILEVQEFLRDPRGTDPTPAEESQGITGKPVLSTFSPVRGLGWAVILEEPVDVALAEMRRMERYAFLLLGLGLIVGVVIIVWVSNKITRPIQELHRGAEIIGKGNLHHRVEIKTGDEIEHLAQEFNKMADELKSSYATLEQKVDQRTRELSALYDVTSVVNQSLEIEPVLQGVIQKVNEIFRFNATRIFLFNPQMDELHLSSSFETRPEYWAQVRVFRRGQGIVGKVAETGEPMIFEDAKTDPLYQQFSQSKSVQKAGFGFFAVFPIKTKARPVGVILFIGEFSRKLASDEVRLLTSMADQIGVAVEKARLFAETATRAKELAALYDLTTTVNQSLDIEPVLQEVVKRITEIFHFDTMRLYLFDAQMEELQVRAAFPADREDLPRVKVFRRGQGIVGKVAETGEALIFHDIERDPRYRELSQSKNTQQTGFRFFAAFPIKAKIKPVGTIVCNSRTPRYLTPEECRLISSMADQIGVAVEKARLFEETTTRAKELSILYDVSTTVNQSVELNLVLGEVIRKALEIIHFDAARIYLPGPADNELILRAYHGISPEFASKTAKDAHGVGINSHVFATAEPVIFQDIQADPQYAKLAGGMLAQEAGFRSYISLPLKAKTKTVGVMNLLNRQVRELLPRDIALLTSMANQVGIALENAALFDEIKTKAKELATLYAISTIISQSLDIDVVLRGIMHKVLMVFGFDAGRIYLLDRDEKELSLIAHEGFPDDINLPPTYSYDEGIMGRVLGSSEPLFFEDLQNDPEFQQMANKRVILRAGYRSQFWLPVQAKGKTVGVVNFVSKNVHRFTPSEVELIRSIVGHGGIALENAALFSEIKQKSVELEKMNVDLQEASRAKSDFLAAMSHELRTPLNVIIGNADLAKDGFFGDVSDEQRDALEKILRHSRVLLKLINDVLALTKMDAGKMGLDLSTFPVNEVITHTKAYTDQINRDGRLKILWKVEPNLPPMTTDALKLEEILQNLIGNAFKFTQKGRIEVRVRDLKGEDRIEFSVADTGIGIEEKDLTRIFEQFHQLKEAHTGDYSGVGLGLSIVKRYLELMQGNIQVESQQGKGSTFTFTLPHSVDGHSN